MRNYLRVVGPDEPSSSPQEDRSVPEHSGQLRFHFDEDISRRIVLVQMDEVDGVILHQLIVELKPDVAIDLRHAVRFDIPGSNRHRFFHDLRSTKSIYVRESIEWHRVEAVTFAINTWILPQRLIHEAIERDSGNVMILIPGKREADVIASALNLALTKKQPHGWRIDHVA